MNNPRRREFKRILYSLKHTYPYNVDVYDESLTYDIPTGAQISTRRKINVKRAILLPGTTSTNFRYIASLMSAMMSGRVNYGGLFETEVQEIIIDNADLPGDFNLDETTCFIVHDRKRFKIINLTELDHHIGWYIRMQALEGTEFFDIFDESLSDVFIIQEAFANP